MLRQETELSETPFGDVTDPEAVFESRAFIQSGAALLDGIRQRNGLMILTGEPGAGKSLLLRRLGTALGSTVNVVHVENSDLAGEDFVGVVCDRLQIATREQTPWDRVRDLRNVLAVRQQYGTSTALLVDDAEHLPDDVLEGLVPLFQAENGRDLLVQIVLAGTEELSIRVHQPELAGVWRWVALEQRLEKLTAEEVGSYVHARLRAGGHAGGALFTRDAIECVAEDSFGIPRRIDAICSAALAATRDKGDAVVTRDTVCELPAELDGLAPDAGVERDVPVARERAGHDAPAATTLKPARTAEPPRVVAIRPSTYELELVPRRDPPWTAEHAPRADPVETAITPGEAPPLRPAHRRSRGSRPARRWLRRCMRAYCRARRWIRANWRRLQPIATTWRASSAAAVHRGTRMAFESTATAWRRVRSRLLAPPPSPARASDRAGEPTRPARTFAERRRRVWRRVRHARIAFVGALTCAGVLIGALVLVSDQFSGPGPARAKVPTASTANLPPATGPRAWLANASPELLEAASRAEMQHRALAERVAMLETEQAALRAELAETRARLSARHDRATERLAQLESLMPPRPGRPRGEAASAGSVRKGGLDAPATKRTAPAAAEPPDHEPAPDGMLAKRSGDTSPASPTHPSDGPPGDGAGAAGGASKAPVGAAAAAGAAPSSAPVTKALSSSRGGARWTRYTVTRGDSLWSIARAHGVAIKDLRTWNALIGDVVRPGQRMAIRAAVGSRSPGADGSYVAGDAEARWYTVRAGDTLWRISEQLEIDLDDLRRHNDLGANDRIVVGQRLQIRPAGEPRDRDAALFEAAGAGRSEATRRLLAQGANPNATSEDGHTALISAVGSGHTEAVEALLAAGADPDLRDREGETPLITAAARGDTDIVEVLLSRGANPDARDAQGWTALIHAAMHGHADTVRTLARDGADPNAKVEGGRSALAAAAWNGHVAVVKVLLESGAAIDAKSDDGWTPLMDGALTGQVDVVKVLMENGANPAEAADDGRTALAVAQERGHAEVAYMLASYRD